MASYHGQGVSQDSSVMLPQIQTTEPKAGLFKGQYLLSALWGSSALPFPASPCKEAGYYARPKKMLKQ